ncbi:uncharacterized protein LOC103516407 [Diaphorina citri]|uniref:Uncharacterized protein LOC103516407 n=1 Tax=Diaphorina citri TaxID=121845 RepID=A0A1S3DDJ5_DIACI|nr:uncharacterized protein LOC103516407 [Diaphorina citri]
MTAVELIPECWIQLEDSTFESAILDSSGLYSPFQVQDNLARIRLEGSPIWNECPDAYNIASSKWYQMFLKERERQRNENTFATARTVRDVIPQSRLASYGNYEYNEERENKYSMDVNVPYSVDTPYSTLCREDEAQEIWMSPLVDKLMLIYLTGGDFSDTRFRQSPSSIPENEELDKTLACTTRKSRSKHRPPHPTDPSRPSGVYTTLSGYKYFSPPRPRGSSEDEQVYSPLHSSYPVYDVNHFSPYKSNMSSSGSSTCSSTSPLHPIYQQQVTDSQSLGHWFVRQPGS